MLVKNVDKENVIFVEKFFLRSELSWEYSWKIFTTWHILQLFYNQNVIKLPTKIRKNKVNKIRLNQFYSHPEEFWNKRTGCHLLFFKKNMCNNIKNIGKKYKYSLLICMCPFWPLDLIYKLKKCFAEIEKVLLTWYPTFFVETTNN